MPVAEEPLPSPLTARPGMLSTDSSFDPFAMLSAMTRGLLTGLERTLWLGRYSHAKKINVDSKKALGSRLRRAPENEEKSE